MYNKIFLQCIKLAESVNHNHQREEISDEINLNQLKRKNQYHSSDGSCRVHSRDVDNKKLNNIKRYEIYLFKT